MSFESPEGDAKTDQESYNERYLEAVVQAQRMSQNWEKLREVFKKNPNLRSEFVDLDQVDMMNRPPKTGIQAWFESQLEFVKKASGGNYASASVMIFRVKEELDRFEKHMESVFHEA